MAKSFSLILLTSLLIFLSVPAFNEAAIRILVGTCHASGFLTGMAGFCNTEYDADCCQEGQQYKRYFCSPPVTSDTRATLNVGNFSQGGDGGSATECDRKFYDNSELVVALSTGWFANKTRCMKKIRINGNGKSVLATVVDQCDSVNGCSADQNYETPCPYDVINATPGVWNALGIPTDKQEVSITWSDV